MRGSFSARASMRNAWRRFDVVMNARMCIERSHVKQWQLGVCCLCYLVRPVSRDTRMCIPILAIAGAGPRSKSSLLSPYASLLHRGCKSTGNRGKGLTNHVTQKVSHVVREVSHVTPRRRITSLRKLVTSFGSESRDPRRRITSHRK